MKTVKDVIEAARQFEAQGQIDNAIKFYQAVIDRMPETDYSLFAKQQIGRLFLLNRQKNIYYEFKAPMYPKCIFTNDEFKIGKKEYHYSDITDVELFSKPNVVQYGTIRISLKNRKKVNAYFSKKDESVGFAVFNYLDNLASVREARIEKERKEEEIRRRKKAVKKEKAEARRLKKEKKERKKHQYDEMAEEAAFKKRTVKREPKQYGNVRTRIITNLSDKIIEKISHKYIAFDVETTGLYPKKDRIVELGAVVFENGKPSVTFSSLVNPGIKISEEASSINHITNKMLTNASPEYTVYPKLRDFLGDALNGETIVCAHNAKFDMGFLSNTFRRLGMDANIQCLDTLSLSREYIKGRISYRQPNLADYLGIDKGNAHRAGDDALVCGKILWHIVDKRKQKEKALEALRIKLLPPEKDLEICAYIQDLFTTHNKNINGLRFRKNSSNYLDCTYYADTFLKFKTIKKGTYVIVPKENVRSFNAIIEPCTKSEGGEQYRRFYFRTIAEIKVLDQYFLEVYQRALTMPEEFVNSYRPSYFSSEEYIKCLKKLNRSEVKKYLKKAIEDEWTYSKPSTTKAEKGLNNNRTKNTNQKRPVLQYDDKDNIIAEYESVSEASRKTGVSTKSIRNAAKGVQKHAGGYVWKYKNSKYKNKTMFFDPADEIRKYKALLDDGIITQEEFNAKKKQLLNL